MTDPSFEAECDVNNIVKRYVSTGLWPQNVRPGFWEDVTNMPEDLMAVHARLREAERSFMLLPSGVRSRFGNDPLQLLLFLEDPANAEEAVALGLFAKKAAPPEPGAPDSGKPPS